MFKVVFVLRQIVLRLKECEVQVVIRKKKDLIPLRPYCKLLNGFSYANITTEFYIDSLEPLIHIQVILLLGNERKMGGEVNLKILDYEPNVIHSITSGLNYSPDKQSRILFDFYYFKDSSVVDHRHMFLSNNRYQSECQRIERNNVILQNQNMELTKQKLNWEKKNEALQALRVEREFQMGLKNMIEGESGAAKSHGKYKEGAANNLEIENLKNSIL